MGLLGSLLPYYPYVPAKCRCLPISVTRLGKHQRIWIRVTAFGCTRLCVICHGLVLDLISSCFLHSSRLAAATSIVTMCAFLYQFKSKYSLEILHNYLLWETVLYIQTNHLDIAQLWMQRVAMFLNHSISLWHYKLFFVKQAKVKNKSNSERHCSGCALTLPLMRIIPFSLLSSGTTLLQPYELSLMMFFIFCQHMHLFWNLTVRN